MSGSQHTPGPWTVVRPKFESAYGPDGMPLFVPNVRPHHEHLANARLIEAAPDLLDALKEIAQASTWCMHFKCMEPIGRLTDVARAAVARAEGRES